MNRFSYYITTYFITSNKDYNSCRNLYSMYQTYSKTSTARWVALEPRQEKIQNLCSYISRRPHRKGSYESLFCGFYLLPEP